MFDVNQIKKNAKTYTATAEGFPFNSDAVSAVDPTKGIITIVTDDAGESSPYLVGLPSDAPEGYFATFVLIESAGMGGVTVSEAGSTWVLTAGVAQTFLRSGGSWSVSAPASAAGAPAPTYTSVDFLGQATLYPLLENGTDQVIVVVNAVNASATVNAVIVPLIAGVPVGRKIQLINLNNWLDLYSSENGGQGMQASGGTPATMVCVELPGGTKQWVMRQGSY